MIVDQQNGIHNHSKLRVAAVASAPHSPECFAAGQAQRPDGGCRSGAEAPAVQAEQQSTLPIEWENVPIRPRTMPVVTIGANLYLSLCDINWCRLSAAFLGTTEGAVETRRGDLTKTRALKSALLLTCAVWPGVASAQEALQTIEVVGVSPGSGGGIDREKVPSNVQTIGAADLDHAKTPSLLDGMVQALPGVSLSDQSGNAFQRNLDYRGFSASPVPGTPQGLAVYQNGTRINEAFGDVVNWDLIPERAINRITLMPNNPLFGLNAIGGALSIDMKNGFNYQGTEVELMGGSFGRLSGGAQSGWTRTATSRPTSPSTPPRTMAGATSRPPPRCAASMPISARAATRPNSTSPSPAPTTSLAAVAGTPIEMLNQRWSSVYTWPQIDASAAGHAAGDRQVDADRRTGPSRPTPMFAAYRASHIDGNGTDAQACDPAGLSWRALHRRRRRRRLNQNGPVAQHACRRSRRSARSTATRPSRPAMAARCRRPAPASCSGTTIISSSAPASIMAARNFQATSELGTIDQQPVRHRHRRLHRPARGRYHPGQPERQEHLCRRLRDQHLRHHLAAVLHGRRPLQLRPDRSAGQHRPQRRCSTATTISSASTRWSA